VAGGAPSGPLAAVGIVLDSSILIHLDRRGGSLPNSWLKQELGLAAITAAELLAGVLRADAAHRAVRAAFVERILEAIPTLPFDLTAARLLAQIQFDLARSGLTVGTADLQIAATALARGWAVATHNGADFARVAGLELLGGEEATS
jgi:tRNA(fMet)-specific endonuclease VapC